MRICVTLFLGSLLFLPGEPARAQDSASVEPGRRVRLSLLPGSPRPALPGDAGRLRNAVVKLTGRLSGMDEESLTVQLDGSSTEVRLLRTSLKSLEVSQGRPSRKRWALIGAGIVGVGLGAVLAISESRREWGNDDWLFKPDPGGGAVAGLILGAPVGAVLGALTASGDRWQKTPVESGMRLSLRAWPEKGGYAGRLAVSF